MTGPIEASSDGGVGIHGASKTNVGVFGTSDAGRGVVGVSGSNTAVEGNSTGGTGVYGSSDGGRGVVGVAKAFAGIEGNSTSGDGVYGSSTAGRGVVGVAAAATGVEGNSAAGAGVYGSSQNGVGIHGRGGRLAGYFEGDVEVTGDIRLANADCAEDFDIRGAEIAEPGTVMVLGDEGALAPCRRPYDKRVAGVISGAGSYRPGIVLDAQHGGRNRSPVALLGKVYCKVDADAAAIEIGDLLTTSGTPGHAMKAGDAGQAFGSVIGKALRPLPDGRGLIPILIALQ
jgi:hypothetical protein